MVVEGEVLNDFSGFVGILIAEFAASGAINLGFKMKEDMIRRQKLVAVVVRDFYKKFYNSLGRVPNHCSSSIEGEVLNDFLRFVGVFITKFSASDAVNFVLKMKGNIIIKNLDLEPTIDAIRRDFLESSDSTILRKSLRCWFGSSDQNPWIASVLHQQDGVGSKRYHVVPYRELDGILVALVARFGVVSKSADRILVSHGG
nr:hypothetical protein [Tanacetum cinerariifolium]